jgi:hypothetical protein
MTVSKIYTLTTEEVLSAVLEYLRNTTGEVSEKETIIQSDFLCCGDEAEESIDNLRVVVEQGTKGGSNK